MKKMTIVAYWHVVHVVLDNGDDDDFQTKMMTMAVMMMFVKMTMVMMIMMIVASWHVTHIVLVDT